MSILIKGVGMPAKCIECRLMHRCGKDDLDYVCMPVRVYVEDLTNAYKPRPDYCPLVPVPEHGRLGDLDKLENNLRHMAKYQYGERQQGILGCCETIRSAPTVVPAEET